MKGVARRGFAVVLGLAFALLLLEGALRAVGYWQTAHFHGGLAPAGPPGKKLVVLALGNSHTFGSGAPHGLSYPAQLQGLFDQDSPRRPVTVINGGSPNVTTGVILQHLDKLLDEFHPDIVGIMAGEPNYWNLYGYAAYLRRTQGGRASSFAAAWAATWTERLYGFRIIRLLSLVLSPSTGAETDSPDPLLSGQRTLEELEYVVLDHWAHGGDPVRAAREIEDHLKLQPGDWDAMSVLGTLEEFRGRIPEALRWYLSAARAAAPGFSYRALSHVRALAKRPGVVPKSVYQEMLATAPPEKTLRMIDSWSIDFQVPPGVDREFFLRLNCRANPTHAKSTCPDLAGLLEDQGRFVESFGEWESLLQRSPLNQGAIALAQMRQLFREAASRSIPEAGPDAGENALHVSLRARLAAAEKELSRFYPAGDGWRHLDDAETARWVSSDLLALADTLRARRIRFFFQTYPPRRHAAEGRPVDPVIRELTRRYRLPLLDSGAYLTEAFAESKEGKEYYYTNDYGPNDSHLNERGYALVARQMHDYLGSQ